MDISHGFTLNMTFFPEAQLCLNSVMFILHGRQLSSLLSPLACFFQLISLSLSLSVWIWLFYRSHVSWHAHIKTCSAAALLLQMLRWFLLRVNVKYFSVWMCAEHDKASFHRRQCSILQWAMLSNAYIGCILRAMESHKWFRTIYIANISNNLIQSAPHMKCMLDLTQLILI